jgi:uncharacterized protein YuzE
MKVKYDKETDILLITLSKRRIQESDESQPGVVLDYDGKGRVVRIEILDASKRVDDLQVQVDLAGAL